MDVNFRINERMFQAKYFYKTDISNITIHMIIINIFAAETIFTKYTLIYENISSD